MAKLVRVSPVDIPQHIIPRYNNRQVCFGNEVDMKAYLHWLKLFSKKSQVGIHAWVLMTNHMHLLCTPQEESAISRMMQSVGRMSIIVILDVVRRFGKGRFKSSLVQNELWQQNSVG